MKPLTKITALLAIGILVWQVSLTGSNRQRIGPGGIVRESDNARRVLYFMASGAALGILIRKREQG